MHRKNPISVLVYNNLFPTPSPTDPPSFSAHLSKNLVGEVRIETANFYGSLDTIEARYPGLNYAFAPHRKRLGRFPHHRRLFEAFDRLGLTESEIQGFCRWEGTLWARERYERDEGVKVIDTTGVEIGEWVDRRQQQREGGINGAHGINVKTDIEVEIEEVSNNTLASGSSTTDRGVATTSSSHQHSHSHHHHHAPPQLDTEMTSDDDDEDEDEDPEEEDETSSQTSSSSHSQQQQIHQLSSSIGFSLNARLLHAAALRESGATNVPMDPEWEQYLKDAQERGELAMDASQVQTLRSLAGQIAHIHQSGVDVESSAAAATQQQQQQQQGYEAPAAPA